MWTYAYIFFRVFYMNINKKVTADERLLDQNFA
jgi:hypothetical protein